MQQFFIFFIVACSARTAVGGVLYSCSDFASGGVRLMFALDSSSQMNPVIADVTGPEGAIRKAGAASAVDVRTGSLFSVFQDKDVAPFGEAGDKCFSELFTTYAMDELGVAVATQGGGDNHNSQLSALHILASRFMKPTEFNYTAVLITNSRPHINEDGPTGLADPPDTGMYDCDTTKYPHLQQVDNAMQLVNGRIAALVHEQDVEHYRKLFEGFITPVVVRALGDSPDKTLQQLMAALDMVMCGSDERRSKFDDVEKATVHVGLSAFGMNHGGKVSISGVSQVNKVGVLANGKKEKKNKNLR